MRNYIYLVNRIQFPILRKRRKKKLSSRLNISESISIFIFTTTSHRCVHKFSYIKCWLRDAGERNGFQWKDMIRFCGNSENYDWKAKKKAKVKKKKSKTANTWLAKMKKKKRYRQGYTTNCLYGANIHESILLFFINFCTQFPLNLMLWIFPSFFFYFYVRKNFVSCSPISEGHYPTMTGVCLFCLWLLWLLQTSTCVVVSFNIFSFFFYTHHACALICLRNSMIFLISFFFFLFITQVYPEHTDWLDNSFSYFLLIFF